MEIVRCGANPHLVPMVLTAVAKTTVARHRPSSCTRSCSRGTRAIMELSGLPVGLSETTSVRHAINFYRYELQSINRMKAPTNATEDLVFTEKIRYICLCQ
ncbi:[Pyruvate dehydrogenase (acetyl-transferring)] kinase isozyme 4 [Phytophthora pseudosyringae]|uniref:[Pyruvate dehydrogenase (Acetyl-transferring)] kinase isozyme 4 n=1 Tax=Phytophthora pseudosyringae TaxID=221518 RepID=A0A8T1W7S7_9STRA|nr:[Pyruvate dehydrogenase (acetyl-transferring)] kinase isozyme 4 [Phytophthora pseudosyringae]